MMSIKCVRSLENRFVTCALKMGLKSRLSELHAGSHSDFVTIKSSDFSHQFQLVAFTLIRRVSKAFRRDQTCFSTKNLVD